MKRALLVSVLVIVLLLGSCSAATIDVTDQPYPLKIWYENSNGGTSTYCLVDENTGVNYVVVRCNSNGGVAITPRLNADGSLYVTE